MKQKASYKYMDTRMLIGLTMFKIYDQPVVSCFLLEVVLFVATLALDQGKGVARLRAKRKPKSHITYSQECKKV